MTQRTWSISELAQEFNITPRTLRFYEDHGIINPRREGQKRIYTQKDKTRLKLALRGKRLGFQLADISSLIDMYDGPGSTAPQLKQYIAMLNRHKEQLESQKRDLEAILQEIHNQEEHCIGLLKKHEQNQS
ncbi:MerR family DNA-binding transcriptional regulator [Advenella alkanexedens]|jgi:DNA-binding transcriptional MerR regulator|uniref:MerR family DNA-binding transcriptional regulator n=1 Tax=Advenella alkanexedens TaxID=1481665 RepID=A0ABS6NMP6_9BURK|nr:MULTISPECIES: MerR family DNA-binding transcriptional regulator [Advenella]MBV4396619.1 MerR family DNA-binding transcriptional regulator [Advenella alkanexedens]MDD3758828.1 MerR family DNA-binding transcriptional regulator [Advenella sp.]NLN67608.1 MerR family DNA-binding transcriptional regulator [Alcaligenaceae bacterium]